MKSAILAVGTELTDGQIVNSNASTLSKRLKAYGPRVQCHLTIPDDRVKIRESLDFCAREADLIFVTGGLGPTSDDFTRDEVAGWAGLKLVYDQNSWQHIVDRLGARQYRVTEIQKQQCHFPEGAVILPNSQGTANGFRLETKGKHIVVLPGPPREVEAVWTDHLDPWLKDLCRDLDPVVTKSWDTMGLGESQIAGMIEPVIKGHEVESGYRVHLPYVEFKISYPGSQALKHLALVQKIEQTLGSVTFARDGENMAARWGQALPSESKITVIDECTGGFLLQRLQPALRTIMRDGQWNFRSSGESAEDGLCVWIRPVDDNTVRIGLRQNHQTTESYFESPFRTALFAERRKQYFTEMALAFWVQCL